MGLLFKQIIKYSPHLLVVENLETANAVLSASELKEALATRNENWEIVLPFHGILGAGGNLPNYLTQDNCSILPNSTGILILKSIFLDLIEVTTILQDFRVVCFFNKFDASEIRYKKNYHFEDFSDMDNIEADEIFIIRNIE